MAVVDYAGVGGGAVGSSYGGGVGWDFGGFGLRFLGSLLLHLANAGRRLLYTFNFQRTKVFKLITPFYPFALPYTSFLDSLPTNLCESF